MNIFITGGTGYLGSRLIPILARRGHLVTALTRAGSENKLPRECTPVQGNALDGDSYAHLLRDKGFDAFIQLVGVPQPSPAKAKEFLEIDQTSGLAAIKAAAGAKISHFIYVSVAHPAPMMHAYIAARSACEDALRASGLSTTILRPWYVLGPGHRWPTVLRPFYWLAGLITSKREAALRLGLVTLPQMLNALVQAVENPAQGLQIMEVPEIRTAAALAAAPSVATQSHSKASSALPR